MEEMEEKILCACSGISAFGFTLVSVSCELYI